MHWRLEDRPADSSPPLPAPRSTRRRSIAAALVVLVALAIAAAGLVAFQRQLRLAEVRRTVVGVVRVAQEAVASEDLELLSSVLADGKSSSLHALHRLRSGREPLPGLHVAMTPVDGARVRFTSSRRWGPLDRAEVDVPRRVSDTLGAASLVQRYHLAQTTDATWRIEGTSDIRRREIWQGGALVSIVAEADYTAARPIHERLDPDLVAFCRRATAAGAPWIPSRRCLFLVTSFGMVVDTGGRATAALPGPPGAWSAADDDGEGLLTRALERTLLRTMFTPAQSERLATTVIDDALIDAWLAPDDLMPVPAAGVDRDWAKLAFIADQWQPARLDAPAAEQATSDALARAFAADVRAAAGRDGVAALLGAGMAGQPLSVRLAAALEPTTVNMVLANWKNAPGVFPADRALLARCPDGDWLFRPGEREAVRPAMFACPWRAATAAAWRPGTDDLTLACTDPTVGDSPVTLVDVTVLPGLGATSPITRASGITPVVASRIRWSPDGRWLAGRDDLTGPWILSAVGGAAPRSIRDVDYYGYPYQYDFPPGDWSPSSRLLVLGQATGTDALTADEAVVWSPEGRAPAWRTAGEAMAWSPVADRLALLVRSPQAQAVTLRVLDGPSGREIRRRVLRRDEIVPPTSSPDEYYSDGPDAIAAMGWSRDGQWVAWRIHLATQTTLVAWRPEDGKVVARAVAGPAGAAWRPDGRILVWPVDFENLRLPTSVVSATAWDPAADQLAPAGPPATHWSADGAWGAAGTAEGLVVTRAGETTPAWRSALRGCTVTGWQPEPAAAAGSALTREREGEP
jgi:hypothetical protein